MPALTDLLALAGIEHLKPIATALLLPPAPLVALILWGALVIPRRRLAGWLLILFSLIVLWLSGCIGWARVLETQLMTIPPTLSAERIQKLRASPDTAIVILGGGRERHAPEYQSSNLSEASLERLRYGLWLARATQLPVAFSGGVGWAQADGDSEAQIAARIAELEFNRALDWTEIRSKDTRENAAFTLPILSRTDIHHVIIVTHGWHMPRAVAAFQAASQGNMTFEPAPMGLGTDIQPSGLEWIPTSDGFSRNRRVGKELLGIRLGF